MENKIKQLFDANLIVGNPRLDAFIAETENRYQHSRVELSDEETEMLAAAGSPSLADYNRKTLENENSVLKQARKVIDMP